MIKATRLRIGVEHCFYIFSIRGYPWNSPSGARRSLPDLGLSMLVKLLVFGFYNLPAYPVDRRHLAGKTEEISRKFRNNTHIAAWLADRYINISSLTGFCFVHRSNYPDWHPGLLLRSKTTKEKPTYISCLTALNTSTGMPVFPMTA